MSEDEQTWASMTMGCQKCNADDGLYPVLFNVDTHGVNFMLCGDLDWYAEDGSLDSETFDLDSIGTEEENGLCGIG